MPPEIQKKMGSHAVQSRLTLAISLTFLILCAEVIGGILANSLSLLSDAAHMFADVFSLSLSWFALRIAGRPSTLTKTFGYHRMEIFAALINGLLLALMAAGILYEAVDRFQNPHEVQSHIVILVGTIGLLVNLGVITVLKSPALHNHDLNIQSAFYHVLGDTIASVGVVIGGVIMWFTGWFIVDAVLATVIAGLLLGMAWKVLSDSVHILLEGVPKGISISEVEKELTSITAIKEIHELHIWSICSNIYALSAHALINDQKVNQVESILLEVQDRLKSKFNITHSTIQVESSPCADAGMLCDMKH